MEIIGKPLKIVDNFVQITSIIDNFGTKKIQVKYFKRDNNGFPNFKSRPQVIYFLVKHWKLLNKEIIYSHKTKK